MCICSMIGLADVQRSYFQFFKTQESKKMKVLSERRVNSNCIPINVRKTIKGGKSLRDVLISRSTKKKKKTEDERSVDDENSPRNLHEALLRSVRKRRTRLRPSTPLSDSILLDMYGRLPRPPMKMNRSSDLWYFGKRKWNCLENMTCHLVRCENNPPAMVAVLNFGMIRLGSSAKFLDDRKCLLFKRENTVFGFHVPPHQVVAIQDILAGIQGAEVLLPSPNSWKSGNRSSRLDGIRKTLVDKFESRCDIMERSRWTGAVIISSLACISLICDFRKLWRGFRRGNVSLETIQFLLISWTGSTALYSWVLCQSIVMTSSRAMTMRAILTTCLGAIVGWFLWISKLIAIGRVSRLWLRYMGPVFKDTKEKKKHVTRMLRRLRVEDFGPAMNVVDARDRARDRARHVVGPFRLRLPRSDLVYDVEFANKLCALELILKDVPGAAMNIWSAAHHRQWSLSLLLSIAMLLSNCKYAYGMAIERRWASEFWGIKDYYSFYKNSIAEFFSSRINNGSSNHSSDDGDVAAEEKMPLRKKKTIKKRLHFRIRD